MTKHMYKVCGVSRNGNVFSGFVVHNDIIEAIKLCRSEGYSVHDIIRGEQVKADMPISISIFCDGKPIYKIYED